MIKHEDFVRDNAPAEGPSETETRLNALTDYLRLSYENGTYKRIYRRRQRVAQKAVQAPTPSRKLGNRLPDATLTQIRQLNANDQIDVTETLRKIGVTRQALQVRLYTFAFQNFRRHGDQRSFRVIRTEGHTYIRRIL